MKIMLLIAHAIIAVALLPALACAEGWQMPNLNPFQRKNSHPAHLRSETSASKNSWWKPKLPARTASHSNATTAQPSTWTKMTRGTKSAWAKTSDALNPFDDANDKPKPITGYNTAFTRPSTRKTAEKKSSWWPSWGEEKPQRPRTVQDWMAQEMPY